MLSGERNEFLSRKISVFNIRVSLINESTTDTHVLNRNPD